MLRDLVIHMALMLIVCNPRIRVIDKINRLLVIRFATSLRFRLFVLRFVDLYHGIQPCCSYLMLVYEAFDFGSRTKDDTVWA